MKYLYICIYKKETMRKIIIISVLAMFVIPSFAQKVEWVSFEKAVKLNKQNPKKIMVDVYTDWCGWCKKLKKNTFNHPDIAQYINENFYPVRFNAESDEPVTFMGKTFTKTGSRAKSPHQLAAALLQGKMSYPSVAYLDEQNRLIAAVPGYYEPKDIEPILKYISEDIYKKQKFEDFSKDFENTLID